ncbi:MAG: cell division protein FtsW [Candidatus Doudnabacteria bacterium]|nr:cell division protein FtsW [Candidatus Doudnabacteria bacterium]
MPEWKKRRNIARTSDSRAKSKLNYPLLYLTIAFCVFGSMMVYSASAVRAYEKGVSPFHYFGLQLLWFLLAAIAGYAAYKIPLKLLPKASIAVMVVTIALLALVLVIGKDLNGARRWIDLGPFDLQPSEIAKLAFVIYLSAWLAKARPHIKDFQEMVKHHLQYDLLPFVMLMVIVCSLIILQPDLDTAVIIAITSLTVYFVSGKDNLHTIGSLFIVLASGVVGIFAALRAQYRLDRVNTYLEFLRTGKVQDIWDTGSQVWNTLIAIGSGGLWGLGFTNSRQKFSYLQDAAFTDSIFSIIGEEFGLVGSVLVILGFLFFMSFGIDIARKATDKFQALLAVGVTTWITLQAFLNIGANLAIIPFGGIPLPFLSYGGSNTIMIMIGVGLLLNISRQSKTN